MTISFPREMPAGGFVSCNLTLERQSVLSPQRSGRLISVEVGPPRWRARLQTPPLSLRDVGVWRAWIESLRGSARTFVFVDPHRRFPISHLSGFTGLLRPSGTAFDGTASGIGLNATRDVITLSGLPAGLALAPGDYVSLTWSSGAKRSLHRILEDGAASGAGTGAWSIEPFVPAYVTAAAATLANPGCIMRLTGNADIPVEKFSGSATFEAMQELEA